MVNPFKLNVITPISRTSPFPVLGVSGGISSNSKRILCMHKSRNPDQTPLSVAFGLGLYCFAMAHKKEA